MLYLLGVMFSIGGKSLRRCSGGCEELWDNGELGRKVGSVV
jgi:hypothetical protein